MAETILEALQKADLKMKTVISLLPAYNLRRSNVGIGLHFAKDQLHNAVTLLDKGYSLTVEVEPLLEEFSNVENVPEAEDTNFS